MPKSKHRRKGTVRPRPRNIEPQERRPTPSPTWVPVTGVALLAVGVLIILVGYLPVVQEVTRSWRLLGLGANWTLVGGFVLISVGFGFLTRWR